MSRVPICPKSMVKSGITRVVHFRFQSSLCDEACSASAYELFRAFFKEKRQLALSGQKI